VGTTTSYVSSGAVFCVNETSYPPAGGVILSTFTAGREFLLDYHLLKALLRFTE
jgi:hypothetical protein